jgi:hypothetical protein
VSPLIVMSSDQLNTIAIESEPEGCSLEPVTNASPATPSEGELIAHVCGVQKARFPDLIRPYTKLMFASAVPFYESLRMRRRRYRKQR